MTTARERDIIRAFVGLSNELVAGYDVVDLLAQLTANCAHLLDIASAGLLLADGNGVLHLVAASSERTRDLEVLQLQRDEGPCLDCYHSGRPVIVADLAEDTQRWPQFSIAAVSAGFASVHAVPMRLRDTVLGTLGLFGNQPGRLEPDDVELAQALVHVACVAIINEKAAADRDIVNGQLQHALSSRVVLEQAKGVLAYAAQIDMDQAFAVLRRYARDHGQKLADVAERLVTRDLPTGSVIKHAQTAGVLT